MFDTIYIYARTFQFFSSLYITSSSLFRTDNSSNFVLSTTGTSTILGGASSIAILAASFSLIIASSASSSFSCNSCTVDWSLAISCPLASSKSVYHLYWKINIRRKKRFRKNLPYIYMSDSIFVVMEKK